MIFVPRVVLVPAVLALVGMGGIVASAYAEEDVTPPTDVRDDTEACAISAAFEKNASSAFDAAPSDHLAHRMAGLAEKTGGKAGAFEVEHVPINRATARVVETSDGTILLFNHRGQRIAVGTRLEAEAPITWFEAVGMHRLRCATSPGR